MFLLAFQAVGREGLETVVFTLAIVFSTSAKGAVLGGAVGLVLALALAFVIYRLGKRVNVALFFKVVGALLMVFAAGLLVDAVENLQQLGWLPIFTHPLWNSGHLLSEDSSFGDIIHSFFGYVSQPTPLEIAVWVVYATVAVTAFLGLWHRRGPARCARPPSFGGGRSSGGASGVGVAHPLELAVELDDRSDGVVESRGALSTAPVPVSRRVFSIMDRMTGSMRKTVRDGRFPLVTAS